MKRELLRLAYRAIGILVSIRDAIQSINLKRNAETDHDDPPPHINPRVEVNFPPSINDYYSSENSESPKRTRRDRVRLLIEGLTLAAVIAAGYFAFNGFKEAQRQATAAEEQVISARQSIAVGQGAFIYFSMAINRTPLGRQRNRADSWQFKVPVVNSGNTPTKNMAIHGGIFLEGYDPAPYRDDITLPIGPRLFMPPHASYETTANSITVERIRALPTKPIYFYGWALYNDIFDVSDRTATHVTMYCFQMTSYFGDPATPDASFNPIYAPCAGKHNCADDECAGERYGFESTWRIIRKQPRRPVTSPPS